MRKLTALAVFCIVLLLFGSLPAAWAIAVEPEDIPSAIAGVFDAVVAMDFTANTLLYSDGASREFSPTGSAVTLMDAYVVASGFDMNEQVYIGGDFMALAADSRRIGLIAGDTWRIEELLAAMLLYGAQDAALVLAEHTYGSQEEFTYVMNQFAEDLGMVDTLYVNPLGYYDARQKITAKDLSLLAQAVYRNETLREILSLPRYTTSGGTGIDNRLQLLRSGSATYDARVTGMGTGSTTATGTNMVLSAALDNREVLVVAHAVTSDQTLCENAISGWLNYFFDEFRIVDLSDTASILMSEGNYTLANSEQVLRVAAGRTLAERMETIPDEFSLWIGSEPHMDTVSGDLVSTATLLYDGIEVLSIELIVSEEDEAVPAIAPTYSATGQEIPQTPPPSDGIPFYTQDDWEPAPETLMGKYGWLVIIVGAAAIFFAMIPIASFIRKRMR